MVHAWSGHADFVEPAIRRGLMLSFGSAVLHSPRVAEAVRRVPDANLLIETDCPDQPVTHGTRGTPADLLAIAQAVAHLRGVTRDHICEITRRNTRRLFPACSE